MRQSFFMPILKLGSVGPAVSDLQRALNLLPSVLVLLGVDGVFGPKTQARVLEFQRLMRLAVDGEVGPETMGKINELVGDVGTAIAIHERRMRVVSVARLEAIGLGNPAILNAKKSGGVDPATEPTDPQHPRNSKDFRLGFARLSVYFHVAAPAFFGPGMQTEENITHLKDKIKPDLAPLPHWCGIFALWAHKAAGTAGIGTWVVNAGISSVTGFKTVGQGAPLLPADIGFVPTPFQHHVLVERAYFVDGFEYVDTIEGNSSPGSAINIRAKSPRSRFASFYRAKSLDTN